MSNVMLTRRVTFSAAHRLHSVQLSDEENRRIFGKCNHLNGHGHNYELEVTVNAAVSPRTDMVMNLSEIQKIIEERILKFVDHKNINEDVAEFAGKNPTAECMAVVFWQMLVNHFPAGALTQVKLQETENNFAVYRGE